MKMELLEKITKNRTLIILLAVSVIIALCIRMSIIFIAPSGIISYYGMTNPIGEAARNLVEGRGYVIDKAYIEKLNQATNEKGYLVDLEDVAPPENEKFEPYYALPPGTSALTAFTFLIFDNYRYIYLRILEAIIDSIGCVIIFLAARALFNNAIGLISSYLYAIWLPVAYIATWPLHDALMPFITVLIFWLFVMGVKKDSMKYYIFAGIVCGVGCYFQPSILLMPVFLGAGLFIARLNKKEITKQIISATKITAVILVATALIITPWIIRNSVEQGALAGIRPGLWSGLWEMSGEFGDNPDGAQLDDGATLALARKELGYDVAYGSPEFDEFFKPKVINLIKDHTGWYIGLIFRRIPYAIFTAPQLGYHLYPAVGKDVSAYLTYLYNDGKYLSREIANGEYVRQIFWHPLGAAYTLTRACFMNIPPLIGLAVFIWMRKYWRKLILVAIVPAYFILLHMFTMITSFKSIVPADVGYIIFCAIAFYGIYDWGSGRKLGISDNVQDRSHSDQPDRIDLYDKNRNTMGTSYQKKLKRKKRK